MDIIGNASDRQSVEVGRHSGVGENFLRFRQNLFVGIASGDVGEGESLHAGGRSELGRFRRGEMAVVEGHSGIAFEKGRFDHHEVRVPDVLGQATDRFCVAHDDKPCALRAVPARPWTVRHSEGREAVRPKMTADLAFERKREAFGVAMTHTKTVVNSPASRIRPSANGTSCNGLGARPSPQSPASIRTTTSSVLGLGAVDRHNIGALPQPQRRKQTRNAEHVVEMAVRQQEPVDHANAVNELFPAVRKSVSLVIGSSLNAGFISGSPRYNYGKENFKIPAAVIEKREKLRTVAARYGVDLRTAALQFSAAPDVAVALVVGARSHQQIAED